MLFVAARTFLNRHDQRYQTVASVDELSEGELSGVKVEESADECGVELPVSLVSLASFVPAGSSKGGTDTFFFGFSIGA